MTDPTSPAPGRDPPIGRHRLLGDGTASALVRPDGEVDWWCAPDLDSPPLLWSLLDPSGASARWAGARMARASDDPAGPTCRTVLAVGDSRVTCWDGLVTLPAGGDGATAAALVRLVRSEGREGVVLTHELELGGFDRPWAAWNGTGTGWASVSGGRSTVHGRTLRTEVVAGTDGWAGIVVGLGDAPPVDARRLASALEQAGTGAARAAGGLRLPRHHPSRAADAMAVLRACTYRPTGAVVAAVTTSLPEAPGADRQFDYRFSWLRDASLAFSVAALLGDRQAAERYLDFARRIVDRTGVPAAAVTDVRGGPVPEEREVPGVAGWMGSLPVRVGNAAAGQVQYDALGLVLEAVSVYLQTGGSLDADTWAMVRRVADAIAAGGDTGPSSGIWELREPRPLVSADIGRWLVLDRAVWIARGWRPLARRRAWKRARQEARARVLDALGDDGSLPQWYGQDPPAADASALMIPLFGMLDRDDPRAGRLVDWVLGRLEAWPFLYRYEPGSDDGFSGHEGAFLPASWWAAAALAALGRVDEATERVDAMCAGLPRLLAEEIDPEGGVSLGNVPLVWSHVEAARTMYLLDAADLRRRWGPVGLWAWRIARYVALRRQGGREEAV